MYKYVRISASYNQKRRYRRKRETEASPQNPPEPPPLQFYQYSFILYICNKRT